MAGIHLHGCQPDRVVGRNTSLLVVSLLVDDAKLIHNTLKEQEGIDQYGY